ncbi:glycosyltransferase family 4 protein [Jatrophihabitans sp.]|uniref:glycosyltransferase family 4 protein n=1 Tax=Jatrophihabitans sp. TaxID=1932789 RepID=UPI0030C7296D|nr:glycosyltransferase [Jatrophihabitans sp.]
MPAPTPATPLRVAMVTPRFAPLVGGVETHVMEVSTRLAARGVEVTVFTIATGSEPRRQVRDGVLVRRFPARVPGGFSWALKAALTREAGDFEVVHVQGVHTALPVLALDAARRAGLPTVLTFHTGGHSSRLRTALRAAQWRVLRSRLRGVDRLVAVCDYEVEYFGAATGLPAERFSMIRNGAEPLHVDADAAPAVTGSPLVLSVGRLERYKGHHRLIATLPELLRRAPGAHLGIVGTGPYGAQLRKQADALGVGTAVSFTSFASDQRGQLGTLLDSADVMALLSDYEAHPVAVMEAVALGVPTLVAHGSGLTELSARGLVDGIDRDSEPEQVADALLRTAKRGRAAPPPALPSWDDAVEDLLHVYAQVTR